MQSWHNGQYVVVIVWTPLTTAVPTIVTAVVVNVAVTVLAFTPAVLEPEMGPEMVAVPEAPELVLEMPPTTRAKMVKRISTDRSWRLMRDPEVVTA